MTTAPVLGQPAAAYPAAPRNRRAELLAVCGVVVAVLGGLLAVRVDPVLGALIAVAALAVFGGAQMILIRRQRQLTVALRDSQEAFRTLVKSSVDPVVIVDRSLRVTFASQSAADLLGLDAPCIVGRSLGHSVHPDDATTLMGAFSGPPCEKNELTVRTARIRHADGRWRLIQATVRDLRTDPDVGALVLYCRDVTARIPAPGFDPELAELSLTDPVTGLPNRSALVRRLGAVQREAGRPFALALIGVEGLAAEVLTPDAEAGVLRALTARLTRALRGEDWLARGKDGDFVALVDGTIADAETVAARLVGAVGPLPIPGGVLHLTAVAGVTALPADVDTGEALRRGDLALRSARSAG
ncbi:MAG TPA: sensor domain-containing diguanylate cyclase, partial [Blastococcus sp.]